MAILSPAGAAAPSYQLAGLPHYGRYADHPGVAEDEFLGQAAPYLFSLVRYDFSDVPKSEADATTKEVRLLLFAFSMPGEAVYNGPATLEVLDREEVLLKQVIRESNADSLYELSLPLPDTGHYTLRATLHAPGTEVVSCSIPFELAAQRSNPGTLIGVILLALLALVYLWTRTDTHRKAPE